MYNLNFNSIIVDIIPYGLGIVGIIVFLAGVSKLIGGKENALSNMFTGILVILIAIIFRLAMINFVIPNLT
jgi:hypothetical protein